MIQMQTQMTEFIDFIKSLVSVPGLSGHEAPVRKLIQEAWASLTDELSTSRLGSLHGLQRGVSAEPRRSILLATHMDAIGLMVTSIDNGFLHLTQVGGIDPRVLPGQLVTVHGREDLPAVIAQPPARLLPVKDTDTTVPTKYLLVDTGLAPERVAELVRVGDLVSFAQAPFMMGSETLAGHTLDNRVSVAALTHCLKDLHHRPHPWDVWAVATVQEEETLGGASTSAYELHPDLAVAIDVTFASSPGTPSHRTFPLGEGLTLGLGPNIHPALHKSFKDLADRLEIPYHVEPMPRHSGTDAINLQVAAEGIPTMVIGIPLRYMHTPVEMVAIKDLTRTGRLLSEFIAGLDESFMERLAWDD